MQEKRRPAAKRPRPNPAFSRCTIGPPKFQGGARVIVDFGKTWGIARRDTRCPGTIFKVRGKFLATKGLARWEYTVRLDGVFCSCREWGVQESQLTAKKKRLI